MSKLSEEKAKRWTCLVGRKTRVMGRKAEERGCKNASGRRGKEGLTGHSKGLLGIFEKMQDFGEL